MSVAIVLRIGQGNFEHGFPVSLQVLERGTLIRDERGCVGLPPAPDITKRYRDFEERYSLLGQTLRLEPVQEQKTHYSSVEALRDCQNSANSLKESLKSWFQNTSFQSLRNQIVAEATMIKDTSVPVIIDVDTGSAEQDKLLRKLPWHLWDLFNRLKNAEPVLKARVDRPISPLKRPVKILAIFGSSERGLELDGDKKALEHLKQSGANITLKEEPSRDEIHKLLWDYSWDILFFAGHSSSEAGHQSGCLQINNVRTLSLDGLEADLDQAVDRGLKLAIVNSCDGLGIARYLADRRVPSMIVMREPVPALVARKFLQYFLKAFSSGKPLYLAVQEARKRLQAQETDEQNPCPAASWLPIICQNPAQPELYWPKLFPWKKVLMGVAVVGVSVFLIFMRGCNPQNPESGPSPDTNPSISPKPVPADIAARISSGDKNLLPSEDGRNNGNGDFSYFKNKGIEQLAARNYEAAVSHFINALRINPNAPETLIYLNNAKIGNAGSHTLAAVVPSGTNPKNALEMLRGFAQAQDKINENGGINGVRIKLVIANDDDDKEIAQKIANYLSSSKPEILAVVGHWTSDVSLDVAKVYANKKLVFITPVSTTTKLTNHTGSSGYVYQTNINNRQGSRALAAQALKTWKKKKVAIFYANVTYGLELRSDFEDAFIAGGGRIVDQFNISDPNFNPEQSVRQAIKNDAEVIFIATDNKFTSKAWEVIRANRNQLKLLGDLANLYSVDTLRECQDAASGMVMAIAWHREKNPPFAESAKSLWGGAEVNHITATSYDAAQALIEALSRNHDPTREGIKNALQKKDFAFSGATGNQQLPLQTRMKFSKAGDRELPAQLVEVQKTNPSHSGTGFDFVPIDSPGN